MSIELIIGIMGIVVPSLTSVALLILRQKEKQKNKEWEKEIKDQMRLYDLQKSNQEDCNERIEKLEKLLKKSSTEKSEIREEKDEFKEKVMELTLKVHELNTKVMMLEKENNELRSILKKQIKGKKK